MEIIYISSLEPVHDKVEIIQESITDGLLDVEFVYDSDFKNAKVLRDFIGAICEVFELPGKTHSRLILVVDELNNNSIEYGSKQGEQNSMRVRVQKKSEKIDLQIEVEDTGNGKKHKSADEMNMLKEQKLAGGFDNHTSIRGRGLFLIIIKIVDELYFKDSDQNGLIVGIKTSI